MDKRLRFIADLIEPLRVAPGSTVKLSRDHDPGYTGQVTRPQATALLADGVRLLAKYQDRLAAQETPAAATKGDVWDRRYREINDWERYLVDNGIHVVKIMLNMSKRKQAKRFIKRIDHPAKNWKFSPSDVRERRYWDEYQRAFDRVLSHTSTQ